MSPTTWEEGQRLALARSGYQCERCGKVASRRDDRSHKDGLEIHHINGRGGDNPHRLDNLLVVCEACHLAADRRQCPKCGLVTSPGALGSHLRRHRRLELGIALKSPHQPFYVGALLKKAEQAGEELEELKGRIARLEGGAE